MFFNSNAADVISLRGNITFNLGRNITPPNGTIGYVSLNELTLPNTNYNINTSSNALVFTGKSCVNFPFAVTPGNYTVSLFMTALNAQIQACATVSFKSIVVTYSDITNMFTFLIVCRILYV